VKSRLMRGRMALKQRLEAYVREAGNELGVCPQTKKVPGSVRKHSEVVTRS
jgi:hypothetical protein